MFHHQPLWASKYSTVQFIRQNLILILVYTQSYLPLVIQYLWSDMNLKRNKKSYWIAKNVIDRKGSWVLLELKNSKSGVGMRDLFSIILFFCLVSSFVILLRSSSEEIHLLPYYIFSTQLLVYLWGQVS